MSWRNGVCPPRLSVHFALTGVTVVGGSPAAWTSGAYDETLQRPTWCGVVVSGVVVSGVVV